MGLEGCVMRAFYVHIGLLKAPLFCNLYSPEKETFFNIKTKMIFFILNTKADVKIKIKRKKAIVPFLENKGYF